MGGCVRDLLLGVKPKDFDVATDARPDRIMDLFPRSGRVGAHFGVVLVRDVFDQVEVATFRSDHDYMDGRHPEQRALRERSARGRAAPRFHHQRADDGSGYGRGAGFRGRPRRSGARHRARHRRSRTRDSAKTICGCCAPCGSRRASGFEIEPGHLRGDAARSRADPAMSAMERVRDELVRILTEGGARRGFELLDASGHARRICCPKWRR